MHDVQYLCRFPKNPVVGLLLDDLLLGGVVDGTPDSGMPIGGQKIAFWRDLRGTPIHTTWVPLKSIVEHFRAILRDFCFWANFSIFRIEKILIFYDLARIKEKRRMDSTSHPPLWSSRMGLE